MAQTIMSIPITAEGFNVLKKELEQLRTVERPAIIKAIAEARAHGDLSENAEYHSAKDKQGMIEARARELEKLMTAAQVIDPAEMGVDGRCIFGAYVTIQGDDKKTTRYRIVSEYEADISRGMLSSTSPLGRALLGKNEGDYAEVEAPNGAREYEIIKIDYTP